MLEMISDLIAIERGRDKILQETQYSHKYFSEIEQSVESDLKKSRIRKLKKPRQLYCGRG